MLPLNNNFTIDVVSLFSSDNVSAIIDFKIIEDPSILSLNIMNHSWQYNYLIVLTINIIIFQRMTLPFICKNKENKYIDELYYKQFTLLRRQFINLGTVENKM